MNFENRPTPRQQEFLDWEMGAFFHFGIRTYYEGHKDWDMVPMPAEKFNPRKLDCRQWVRTVKQAGCKYAILVTKHHDGFANWPSKYSDYSVAQTPWKDGRGDVVREFTDACREEDMKVGLYYSPAQFGFTQKDEESYNQYFIDQVTELLTGYGKIDYIWFDANGSGDFQYDVPRIVKVIRTLQPEIMIFNMWDPDTRWVGNESGIAGMNNRTYVDTLDVAVDMAEGQKLAGRCFLPAECDCCMRGHDWFYSAENEHKLRTPDELMGFYYQSVGRGSNLLLNIGPDRDGLLPEKDVQLILGLGEAVRSRFTDGKLEIAKQETFQNDAGETVLRLELAADQPVNHVVLREDLSCGEQIAAFRIMAHPESWGGAVDIYYGKAVGHKHIACFPTVITKRIDIIIEKSEDTPKLLDADVIYAQ